MKTLSFLLFVLISTYHVNSQVIWTNKTKLKGSVGKYPINMTLAMPYGGGSTCITVGEYCYLSNKRQIELCSEDGERIVEQVNGTETGFFILEDWDKKIGQTVLGTWYSMDETKKFPVTLKVISKSNN